MTTTKNSLTLIAIVMMLLTAGCEGYPGNRLEGRGLQEVGQGASPTAVTRPSMDSVTPPRVETATFALG